MSRIDYLRSQIVCLAKLAKELPSKSPAAIHTSAEKRSLEAELDQLLANQSPTVTAVVKNPIPARNHAIEEISRQLLFANLPPYEKEWIFHPSRRWRFDFAWTQERVAVEVHGGIFRNGRHTRGAGFQEDREKVNEATILGWIVLEVTAEQIQTGKALDWIEKALAHRQGKAEQIDYTK